MALAKGGPTFSYEPLFSAVRDLLVLHVPYEQIAEGIRRGVKQPSVQANFLGLLPLIRDHFEGVSPAFVNDVAPRLYAVGRGLMVPFNPPLIYGLDGRIHFPWLSFWRSNPLAGERLSLFVTIVEEVLLQDSDLEDAKFTILDFSAPSPKHSRALTVIDAKSIPRVSSARKVEMLDVFAEGFLAAKAVAASAPAEDEKKGADFDANQLPLDF
ncbi:hypothetical protein [Luteimonas sp. SDU101]|uniref:hypothetical protein n=1 Tax=Luteimonas sp. SDU101 TaxID=3422593 RepID=UPI003EBDBA74